MKRLTLFASVASAVSLALLALGSSRLLAGCNGAQFAEAPPPDSGPPCSTLAPIIACDAGGLASPNACTADPTSNDSVVARIPPGNYPEQCTVQFYFTDFGGTCSAAHNPCACLPGSGDAGPDATPQAQWSACADAGISGLP